MFRQQAEAVYLNDYSHYSDVERRFLEVRENYDKGGLVVNGQKVMAQRCDQRQGKTVSLRPDHE